jgi:hypothetical protein
MGPTLYLKRTSEFLTAGSLLTVSWTLNLLMSYIYGAPCKARNFNVVYIWTYVRQRWKPSLSICCTMFQHRINTENYPMAQLCVNTLPATKVTLITDGISFGSLRVKTCYRIWYSSLLLTQYCLSDKIEKNCLSVVCSTYWERRGV